MPIPADQDYLTEEARLRGGRPTIRATVNPDGTPQVIEASEIINPGKLFSAIPRNFQSLQTASHVLAVNNRAAAFIPSATTCPGAAADEIKIEQGFKLADNSVSWLTLFTGRINRTHSPHAWKSAHNAIIESSSIIAEKLQTKIGTPASDGTRQPFMHGTYLANAELEETTDPAISEIVKTGTGTGTLQVLGVDDYSGNEDLNIRVKAESTGEIGTATFKWSLDGGQTWEKTGILSQNITLPVTLTNRIKVYWIAGTGNDLVANDYWDFTISAQVYKYVIPGFPFSSIPSVYNNAVEIFIGFTCSPTTGEILLTGSSGRLRARTIKDELTHPVDVIEDILTEVGLSTYINALSFAAAKEITLPYNIGTRFENVTAAKAIQLITQACLFFFWIDADEIYLYAYTGELI
jgi:hypothetical protein